MRAGTMCLVQLIFAEFIYLCMYPNTYKALGRFFLKKNEIWSLPPKECVIWWNYMLTHPNCLIPHQRIWVCLYLILHGTEAQTVGFTVQRRSRDCGVKHGLQSSWRCSPKKKPFVTVTWQRHLPLTKMSLCSLTFPVTRADQRALSRSAMCHF